MRPFRSEDEGLLFGVAKLAFADCDDGRTIATLERDTVFVAELAGQPAGYVALEESAETLCIEQLCVHPAHEEEGVDNQLLDWAEGYAISTARRGSRSSSSAGTTAPTRSTAAAASSPPGRIASSSSCRRLCSLAVVLAALALPGGGVRARAARRLEAGRRRGARDRAAGRHAALRRRGPAGGRRARSVDARGRSVLAGDAPAPGTTAALVLPLRPGLPRGAYTVRWRVVSNDGHLVSGVLAFAVGAGSPRPVPTLVRRRRDLDRVDPPPLAVPRRRARRRRAPR